MELIKNLFTKLFFMFEQLISFFVRAWQKTRTMRSFFGFPQCCFYPSCSDYCLESIKKHGPIFGLVLFTRRLIKCHPLSACGIDEVPSNGF